MKNLFLLAITGALLTGCASNPFGKFYRSYSDKMPVALQHRLQPASNVREVLTASAQNHRNVARPLEERGYICIGFSGFVGGPASREQVIDQAKKVGAEYAIYTVEYSHTEQGVMPLFSYQPGQTYTTHHQGSATATVYSGGYSARGYGTYSGTSTTTTPGTVVQSGYMPYQRQVFEHGASFWCASKPGIFGARIIPIPEVVRSTLQRNTGVLVDYVVNNGPAFRANIMGGDVIIQIAEKPIATVEEFMELLPTYSGQNVSVQLIRGTEKRAIEVHFGNP